MSASTAPRAPRALLALLAALLLTSMSASAQQPPAGSARVPAGGAACNAVARTISLVVRRADGTPVTDAVVTARAEDGRVLARLTAATLDDGNYLVFTDERPPELSGGRGTVRLTVAWRRQTRRVRWTLGPDPSGCRTVLLGGAQVVRFR